MNTFARLVPPVLQRSSGACRALQFAGRSLLTPPLAPLLVRGQQTLGSASLPVRSGFTGPSVRKARALKGERQVEVQWGNGGHSLYPYTWLRDNCQCSACMLQSAVSRRLLLVDLDVNTGVKSVEVTNNNQLSIVWPDQHLSVFDSEWLKKHCFSDEARKARRDKMFFNERYLWGSTLNIPTMGFQEVLQDDEAALSWLLALRRVGMVHLKGTPTERGQLAKLGDRIGFLRMTHYGLTFQVQDKPMANNLAYTAGRLSAHTDLPVLQYTPGIQLLHCIIQAAEGGVSEMVDGFHAAEVLRQEDGEAFRILSSLLVDFNDVGTDYCDFFMHNKKHTIELDNEGQVIRVHLNNATRDSVLDLPLHQVQPFYSALRTFTDILNRPENVLTYTMEPGDVVTFDNSRLLHGRRSYVSSSSGLRHLEGAYLDWDETLSRIRMLRKAVQARQ
uniref:gamma-butyrobetaine dioxygenase n=2 Tax=Gouania willdenowi TaxID=441366 RepID=A0A8C5D3B4_GOUWI